MGSRENYVFKIIKELEREYLNAHCELNYSTPFQLLIAVILSARCTDKRVNIVTKELFSKYPTIEDFNKLKNEELEKIIFSTGFYKNKAKNILKTCKILVEKFNKIIPSTMKDLLSLSGVARKTANVILGEIFKFSEGIVVDTHVIRISQRLNLTVEKHPIKIEKDLMRIIPKKYWIQISHYFIQHGRKLCKARNPKCGSCFLNKDCPFFNGK